MHQFPVCDNAGPNTGGERTVRIPFQVYLTRYATQALHTVAVP